VCLVVGLCNHVTIKPFNYLFMASGDAVQQIKDRLNIIDVISPYAELVKSGRHFVARC
jgi:hypothetical protein